MAKPLVLTKRKQLIEWVKEARANNKSLGFVPTMGALHDGHKSLMQQCTCENDLGLASIFVNPKQFGPNEDFSKYPRTFQDDLNLLQECGISAVFAPSMQEIYPANFSTQVKVQQLDSVLCGKDRPGHFDGVCTIVLLLLNLSLPTKAYFGLKDYQQYCIIKRMCEDLAHSVELVAVPTVREADGLALSSRNRYLDEAARIKAKVIPNALSLAAERFLGGEKKSQVLLSSVREVFEASGLSPQYLEIRDAETLKIAEEELQAPAVIAVAMPLAVPSGFCRLIDNVILANDDFHEKILIDLLTRTKNA